MPARLGTRGDGSNTPRDEDYAEPPKRPEEDDIDLDTYNKLIGTQIKPDNDRKATVRRQVTGQYGRPVGVAHINPLLAA